jgi:lambda family phage tail tape measure protein
MSAVLEVLIKTDAAKATSELKALETQAAKTATGTEKIEKATQAANSSYKGFGGGVRNASYQLSDFVVQVQGGTSALRALGQQLPQLLAGFGLFGVVAGLASTVVIAIIENFDLFASKSDKASQALNRFNTELNNASGLGDRVSTFVKAFGSSSADGWVDYVRTYNKASAEQREEMNKWLDLNLIVEQAKLQSLLSEQQVGTKLKSYLALSIPFAPSDLFKPDEERQTQLTLLIRKQTDEIKRLEAARRGDFAAATQGNKASEQAGITVQQRIDAFRAEAQYIGVSNAEREKGMVLAELEAQAKRNGIGLNQQEIAELKQLIELKHTALQTVEIEKYATAQKTANNILREQGMAIQMSTREYQKLVEQKRLEGVIQEKTVGWNATEAETFRQRAQFYLQEKQALDDINYAKQRTFGAGATAAIKKYGEDASNIGTQVSTSFTNAFRGMEDAIVQFTMTGKASFTDFALSVIADIQRILIKQALLGAGLGGGGNGALGGLIGAGLTSLTSYFSPSSVATDFTAGGTISSYGEMNALPSFAVGTNYVPKDMIAQIHKGEAIVPAQYNPSAGGAGGNVNNVTVQVNMNGSDKINANSSDANKLGVVISNAVKAEIVKQQRNGGLLSGA